MTQPPPIPFDNLYATLPSHFYAMQRPTPVAAPQLIRLNRPLAEMLGMDPDWLQSDAGIDVLAGNRLAEGSQPIATVYAGHQFGGWNPRLGDGRAILLGEVIGRDGRRYDVQLKGAGRTPYSRGGDGRSPLGPVLREYIVSEAMAALGVPTTRSLAAVASGEAVYRETPEPGGILTRVASSHIRIGTFQYFQGRGDIEALRLLTDHVMARDYVSTTAGASSSTAGASHSAGAPHADGMFQVADDAERPALALLDAVVQRQARLIARWQLLGFIHGVMNTDNMLISGETIDYGPCAFMDSFDPATVYSSIDAHGRYAWRNQPGIAQWNLAWLAQALLPLIDANETVALPLAQGVISEFVTHYQNAYAEGMARKLGLSAGAEATALGEELLQTMTAQRSDFTLAFRRLAELVGPAPAADHSVVELFDFSPMFAGWLQRWRAQLALTGLDESERQPQMFAASPAFIARNHRVEEAIRAAVDAADFAPFHRLVERLADPCSYQADDIRYAQPPEPDEVVARTFCGT